MNIGLLMAALAASPSVEPGSGPAHGVALESPAVAFHYGNVPPLGSLAGFDWVVLEPSGVKTASVGTRLGDALPIAYVSIGEVHRGWPWAGKVPDEWRLGTNGGWNSAIVDPSVAGWQTLLLDEVLPALWARGFRGFFFDTLDSFEQKTESEAALEKRWAAVASFVSKARAKYPEARLLANRGFPILDTLVEQVDGLVAESLYAGWQPTKKAYADVADEDREWLLPRLDEARARGLEVIVVDYLPPGERQRAREVASRIAERGFVPWVGPSGLDGLGVGALEPVGRKVWLVWDSKAHDDVSGSPLHRTVAMPLEYLGLVPEYIDVREGLPEGSAVGRIAGIVTWLDPEPLPSVSRYRAWLRGHLDDGIPWVAFGGFGPELDREMSHRLGLERGSSVSMPNPKQTVRSELLGFEAEPGRVPFRVAPLRVKDAEPLLELSSGEIRHQPIAVTAWGGYALDPHALVSGPDGTLRWALDPFAFLERVLKLPPEMPRVDLSTENGRRVLVAHIDGDGSASRSELPGNPLAITVMRRFLEDLSARYTVSVVEGETSPEGLHPELSRRLEAEAKKIFALDRVRAASHGFSHPFVWKDFERGKSSHLELGATPSLEREIEGSLEYVSRLAGAPVHLFLWTGDALPGASSLAEIERAGALQLNGGFTQISDLLPSVAHVSPRVRPVGRSFQVYAPILNENVYTDRWRGPFWGYRRVIETFERTGKPRRLGPIGIYHHFYSATKVAGMRALEQVWADARSRAPLDIYAETWVRRVLADRSATVARRLDGAWVFAHMDGLPTLRIPDAETVDLGASGGVVGTRRTEVGHYVHLDGRDTVVLRLGATEAEGLPQLVEASATLRRAERVGASLELEFEGPPPVAFTLSGGRCYSGRSQTTKEGLRYTLQDRLQVLCRGEREGGLR